MASGLDKPCSMAPEALAFLGDAVYELCVRRFVSQSMIAKASVLSALANTLSCASFQAKAAKMLFKNTLTPQECSVFMRGRNLAHKNYPHSASKMDYKYATALECVFGWLEKCHDQARIKELFVEITQLYKGVNDEL